MMTIAMYCVLYLLGGTGLSMLLGKYEKNLGKLMEYAFWMKCGFSPETDPAKETLGRAITFWGWPVMAMVVLLLATLGLLRYTRLITVIVWCIRAVVAIFLFFTATVPAWATNLGTQGKGLTVQT